MFNMSNSDIGNKMMNRFFRKVDGVVWDLMTGRIGIKTKDGITTIEGDGDDAQVVINMLDQFGMELPAFAQSTPVSAVTVGDLIYGAKEVLGWVVKKNEKSLVLMKPDGTRSTWSPPKVQMLGLDSGVMVLRSLINMLPGGQGGLGQMQNMLMPLMMMGGGEDIGLDLDSMMPLMLMSQMGVPQVAADGSTPAAAYPFGGGNMMQTMLLMQMMKKLNNGGNGGNNQGGRSGFRT
jgi:hypothetical protein